MAAIHSYWGCNDWPSSCECIVLKRLTPCNVCKSLMSLHIIELNYIFLWDCQESVIIADVCFVCELPQWRLSPGLICECGARQRYLERSNMLTNLFCYFRDNTREFLLNMLSYNCSHCWAQTDVGLKSMSGMVLQGIDGERTHMQCLI